MAVVGCLGDIVFEVSGKTVHTLRDVEWSGSARYAVHERHLQNALTEFTGLDPDKMGFEMTMSYLLGVDVLKQLVRLWEYERKAVAVPLVIGSRIYGKYRWNLVRHSIKFEQHGPGGSLLTAGVSVELQEYIK